MYKTNPLLASGLDQFKHYLNNPDREIIDLLRQADIKYIAVSDSKIKTKFDDMDYEPLVYLDGVAIYELGAVDDFDLKSLVLCNTFMLDYDFSTDRSLPSSPSNTGIWSNTGISSNGVEGALLYGPYVPVSAGVYNLKMYGKLSSGSVNVDVVSQVGTVTHLKLTLDKSLVDSDGNFSVQKTVSIDRNVNDLQIRVWVNKESNIEIQGYVLSKVDSHLLCQGLMFNDMLELHDP